MKNILVPIGSTENGINNLKNAINFCIYKWWNDKVYLGTITAKLVKQTEIPLLIVPKDYLFRKFDSILVAFKNGHFEKENVLSPIHNMVSIFKSKINLLQVITPETTETQLRIA